LEGLTMISWGLFHTTCCGILWTWQISVSTTFLRGPPPNPIPSTAWWCFFFPARDDLQMKRFALFLLAWPSDHENHDISWISWHLHGENVCFCQKHFERHRSPNFDGSMKP
jgi:hypothetical protein